jgi:hypothetical protein
MYQVARPESLIKQVYGKLFARGNYVDREDVNGNNNGTKHGKQLYLFQKAGT